MFFFIVFDHVNACASMHSLVKIHNSLQLLAQSRQKQSRNRCSHCNCISHLKHYLIRSHHVVNGLDNFGHLNQINNTIAINIIHPEKIYSLLCISTSTPFAGQSHLFHLFNIFSSQNKKDYKNFIQISAISSMFCQFYCFIGQTSHIIFFQISTGGYNHAYSLVPRPPEKDFCTYLFG